MTMMSLTAVAAPRTLAQMKEAAAKAINVARSGKHMAPRRASDLKTLKATESYQIIGVEQGGFAVVAADDLVPEVLGVSTARYSEGRNTNFQWWLEAVEGAVQYAVQHGVKMNTTKPDPTKYPTQVGPLMTSKWDQLTPYNNLCPVSEGGDRCYTGCVATAMAQVLNYHKVPVQGIGSRTIYYPYGNYTGTAVTADFGDHVYDWDNMLDEYAYGNYNEAQAMAVAVLMRDCGVAADMQYGGYLEDGSGAYSQDAADGLRMYFGIEDAQCLERDYYSESVWMDMVYKELSENGPCYYGGASYSSGGHAFVLHGYNAEGKVYVNWGWSGDDDGYFDIALLNPSYYHFDMQQDMIIGVKGEPRELTDEVVVMTEAGTLSSQLGDDKIGSVGTLKVTGDINSSDLLQIRRMAGVDGLGEKTDGYLQELDLSEARIIAGGDAYLNDNGHQLTTADDELSEKLFFGCKYLKKLSLPEGIKVWGKGALGLCPQLTEVQITPAEDATFVIEDNVVWNTEKTEIIAVLPAASGEMDIAKGTTALQDYAFAGCARVSKVVVPSSVTTIGRGAFQSSTGLQEIRIAGKDIPTLTGADVFTGVSLRSCLLFVPAGMKSQYAQLAQWKDFKGSDYDNIKEFGSSVQVRNTIRYYGEENPEFYYIVSGDPITGEPVMTCDATPTSPAGKYPIHISAGTITDETVELVEGYMIVQKVKAQATVQDATREAGQENPEFTLVFEGLVNDETEPVWTEEPVFSCEATADSPEGDYPITVTATAESYKLTFVAGTLTVTPSTVVPTEDPTEDPIEDPTEDPTEDPIEDPTEDPIEDPTGVKDVKSDTEGVQGECYDLSGRRVTNPTKGLYIRNGKKYKK